MVLPMVEYEDELAQLINEIGFLPFFDSPVPGFSLKNCVPPELWFPEEGDGVWEWKGPAITLSGCAYGKYIKNKAAFISREWFPDFANYRRDGYDFDARYDDGLASFKEKRIYDTLEREESMLSKELRKRSGFVGEGKSGYETALTRLQMRGYLTTTDFEYALDSKGNFYGWGIARYATPEAHFGEDFTGRVYARSPAESAQRIMDHLRKLLPHATEEQLRAILG